LMIFWKKNAAGRSSRWSCSCTTMPQLTGHMQPRSNCPNFASIFLIILPILQIWPRRTPISSLDWKRIKRSPFFVRRGSHCCRRELFGRKTFWIFLVPCPI
jgi:hypothetical protein